MVVSTLQYPTFGNHTIFIICIYYYDFFFLSTEVSSSFVYDTQVARNILYIFSWAYEQESLHGLHLKKKKCSSKGMYLFNLTLYCQIALQSACMHLYSHNCACFSTFSLLVSEFLNLTNIMDIEWHLLMVLLGIYLITMETEHLLKCY